MRSPFRKTAKKTACATAASWSPRERASWPLPAEKSQPDAWSKLIIGKRALISHVEETYKDKTGVDQIRRKVAFDGYESADKAVKAGGDTFSDI